MRNSQRPASGFCSVHGAIAECSADQYAKGVQEEDLAGPGDWGTASVVFCGV